jgi:putative endonuclease
VKLISISVNSLQVYIALCSDGSYYTGVSNDVESRIVQHNLGIDKKSFTYSRRPIKCVWFSDPMDPNQAIQLEKQIKGWSRKKKEAIIRNQWTMLPELSQNKLKRELLKNKPVE